MSGRRLAAPLAGTKTFPRESFLSFSAARVGWASGILPEDGSGGGPMELGGDERAKNVLEIWAVLTSFAEMIDLRFLGSTARCLPLLCSLAGISLFVSFRMQHHSQLDDTEGARETMSTCCALCLGASDQHCMRRVTSLAGLGIAEERQTWLSLLFVRSVACLFPARPAGIPSIVTRLLSFSPVNCRLNSHQTSYEFEQSLQSPNHKKREHVPPS
jgi:hypothetical protein